MSRKPYKEPERRMDNRNQKKPSARTLPVLCHDSHNNLYVVCGSKRSSLEAWKYDLVEEKWSMLENNVDVNEESWIHDTYGTCATSPAANPHCETCQRPRIVHWSGELEISLLELRGNGDRNSGCSGTNSEQRFYDRRLKLCADESLGGECWSLRSMVAKDPHTFYQATIDMAEERPEIYIIDIVELTDREDENGGGEWTWRLVNESPVEYWREQPASVRKFIEELVMLRIGEGPYVYGNELYIFRTEPLNHSYVDFRKVLVCGLDGNKGLEVLDTLPDTTAEAADLSSNSAAAYPLVETGQEEEGNTTGFPPNRVFFCSVVVDGYLYVLGGLSIPKLEFGFFPLYGYIPLADVWRLPLIGCDSAAGQQLRWEKMDAVLELPVYQASALHHKGTIYVFGGIISSGWSWDDHEITERLQKIRISK